MNFPKGGSESALRSTMLSKLSSLFEELTRESITYCHWKSNFALAEALEGKTDVDLLIRRSEAGIFRGVLTRLDFRPALQTDGDPFPSVEHYYALDEESFTFVHVHAYYRVITGESLAKNYRFPLEDMLLENTRAVGLVQLPTKGAELVIFTLRMMLKHTSLVELVMLARGEWRQVPHEARWLMEPHAMKESAGLLQRWLPTMDVPLFSASAEALKTPSSFLKRVILAHRVRRRLRTYARSSSLRALLRGTRRFMVMVLRRLRGGKRPMVPLSGGALIAFVGTEASGKSTVLSEVRSWLGEHFAVDSIHAGKPTSTLITFLPNLLLPTLRALLPKSRSTRIEMDSALNNPSQRSDSCPLIFAIRSVLLAHDRRALLRSAFARAANGAIVLSDRYPSLSNGAPDSPQLARFDVPRRRFSVRNYLSRLEERLYRDIPAPDLVIHLSVPLEIAVARNKARSKVEPEDYVRHRYTHSRDLDFGRAQVHRVSTNQPIEETLLQIKKAIWSSL